MTMISALVTRSGISHTGRLGPITGGDTSEIAVAIGDGVKLGNAVGVKVGNGVGVMVSDGDGVRVGVSAGVALRTGVGFTI